MTTFTWIPDYSAAAQRLPRLKSAKFGDGYEQRYQDGLNHIAQVWNVTFANRDQAESNAIDNFLIALGGVDYFEWTPPRSAVQGRYICKEWQRQVVAGVYDTITAKFEQVFDPA